MKKGTKTIKFSQVPTMPVKVIRINHSLAECGKTIKPMLKENKKNRQMTISSFWNQRLG